MTDWRDMPRTDREALYFIEGAVREYARGWIELCDKSDRERPGHEPQNAKERRYVKRHRARANRILKWLHKLAAKNGGNLPGMDLE